MNVWLDLLREYQSRRALHIKYKLDTTPWDRMIKFAAQQIINETYRETRDDYKG